MREILRVLAASVGTHLVHRIFLSSSHSANNHHYQRRKSQHRASDNWSPFCRWSTQHHTPRKPSSKTSRPPVTVARLDVSFSYRPGRSRSQKRKASASERTRSRIRDWKRAMIRRKPETPPSSHLSTPPPEASPRSSTINSDWDADDEENMSMEDLKASRPPSLEDNRHQEGPYHPQRPTLPDVLSNSAPPPWTLSAFTAYLSQNHCLENLEFTMEAERYRKRYDALAAQMSGMPITSEVEECRYVRMLWQRLINAYIMPDCPREINIPSSVRERLLLLPNHSAPPQPEDLEAAVKIIYNLMEESVLISFLNEVPSSRSQQLHHSGQKPAEMKPRKRGGSDSSNEKSSVRSRSRKRASPTASLDVPLSRSRDDPTGRLTPMPPFTRSSRAPSHTSSGSGESGLLDDDSASASSPGREPMTPPNTPPSSDFGGHSPRNRNDNTWKNLLGWKKKSSSGMRDNRFPTIED